jgi:hypothetical protein
MKSERGGERFRGDAMAVFEHALQAAVRVSGAEKFSKPTERKIEFDAVFKPTSVFGFGDEKVGVFPAAEGARDHGVAKHTARFARGVFSGPDLREGTELYAEFYFRSELLDAPGLFDDLSFLPRRSEAFERAGQCVPTIDGFGGGRHAAAIDEKFTHGKFDRALRGAGWSVTRALRRHLRVRLSGSRLASG